VLRKFCCVGSTWEGDASLWFEHGGETVDDVASWDS
jgi:hypothetical protein